MKHTFYLKDPKAKGKTLIFFRCRFRKEEKRFFYSTGEVIKPKDWNFTIKMPKGSADSSITYQLNRYTNHFNFTESLCKKTREDFTTKVLRNAFDEEFKKAPTTKNIFFDSFKELIDLRTKTTEWSKATIKRYNNVYKLLERFEKDRKYKLTFNSINDSFHAEFTDYCLNKLGHVNNTYSRNLGFLFTFLHWSIDKGYTYNNSFTKFKRKKHVLSKQIALKIEDLEKLMQHTFESKTLERVRDIFVFQCVTGMRYGELKLFRKHNISNDSITLKEEKDETKEAREIPQTDISRYILSKYNNKLPLLTNQKQNKYIKDVFKEIEYTHNIEKVINRGKDIIREEVIFADRITTHTSRRTFITMMKNKGITNKVIAEITGQTTKTIDMYYQVDDKDTIKAVEKTFELDFMPKLRKA